jgi:hypothetical protein
MRVRSGLSFGFAAVLGALLGPARRSLGLLPPRSARLERDEARGGPGDRTALIRPFALTAGDKMSTGPPGRWVQWEQDLRRMRLLVRNGHDVQAPEPAGESAAVHRVQWSTTPVGTAQRPARWTQPGGKISGDPCCRSRGPSQLESRAGQFPDHGDLRRAPRRVERAAAARNGVHELGADPQPAGPSPTRGRRPQRSFSGRLCDYPPLPDTTHFRPSQTIGPASATAMRPV